MLFNPAEGESNTIAEGVVVHIKGAPGVSTGWLAIVGFAARAGICSASHWLWLAKADFEGVHVLPYPTAQLGLHSASYYVYCAQLVLEQRSVHVGLDPRWCVIR